MHSAALTKDIVRKLCRNCNQEKPTSEFYPSRPSRCKSCRKLYLSENPWLRTLLKINYRCNDKECDSYKWYGGKGIKNFLTMKDLEFLWNRDKAQEMKYPSIDRIDSNGNYKLDNCRYIEKSDNTKRLRPFDKDSIDEIRSYYRSGKFSQVILAKKYSVRQSTISNIIRREHYSEV